MTGDTTPVWLVMGGAGLLQVLGAGLGFTFLGARRLAFCLASGLLLGLTLHGLLAAVGVLARFALGALPLYSTVWAVAATGIAGAVALATCARRATRDGLPLPTLVAALASSAFAIAALTLVAISFDLSTLTPDSLGMIEAALELARIRDPELAGLPFLTSRGMLGVLIHAPAAALPFDFLWFASPVLGAACLATLASAAWSAIRDLDRGRGVAALVVAAGVTWLLGCFFWLYQLFYVHVNQLAGALLLVFAVAAWRSQHDRDDAWLPVAGLALLGFQMLRVEGTLFAALLVAVVVLERAASDRSPRAEAWLVLPGVAWCGALALAMGGDPGIVDAPRLLATAGLLLACLPLGRLARSAHLATHRERLPGAALVALGLALLVAFVLRPAHMTERLGVLAWNALGVGLWSSAWAMVPAFVLASPVLGRVPHQRLVQHCLAAAAIGLVALTYVGFWREGWYDSGNRMLTHALPTLVWLGMLRAAAIAPPSLAARPASPTAADP